MAPTTRRSRFPEDGVANIVDLATGEVLLTQNVEAGDIWMCTGVKDAPIRDWVKLAVNRARNPVCRCCSGSIRTARTKTNSSQEGSDLSEGSRHQRARYPDHVAGPRCGTRWNVSSAARHHRRDRQHPSRLPHRLFPILELGTSAKMPSIVPLMAGGGMYETGRAVRRPSTSAASGGKHLRWDSLGEFLALAVSLEDLGIKTGNQRPRSWRGPRCRDRQAAGQQQSPSRKTGELDNRGSQFYLALYWAQELAAQGDDKTWRSVSPQLATALAVQPDVIVAELNEGAGHRSTSVATTTRTGRRPRR